MGIGASHSLSVLLGVWGMITKFFVYSSFVHDELIGSNLELQLSSLRKDGHALYMGGEGNEGMFEPKNKLCHEL